jgi:hypothetical protein
VDGRANRSVEKALGGGRDSGRDRSPSRRNVAVRGVGNGFSASSAGGRYRGGVAGKTEIDDSDRRREDYRARTAPAKRGTHAFAIHAEAGQTHKSLLELTNETRRFPYVPPPQMAI